MVSSGRIMGPGPMGLGPMGNTSFGSPVVVAAGAYFLPEKAFLDLRGSWFPETGPVYPKTGPWYQNLTGVLKDLFLKKEKLGF